MSIKIQTDPFLPCPVCAQPTPARVVLRHKESHSFDINATRPSNYENRHPDDMVLHPLSEIREWDEALKELGIQDSTTTPVEAIRELNAEIERLREAALTRPVPKQDKSEHPKSATNYAVGRGMIIRATALL